jgi:hypothetical protein
MTKEKLAKEIIETIENSDSEIDALESVIILLDVLEPKDRKIFSKWGYENDQTTEEECWK